MTETGIPSHKQNTPGSIFCRAILLFSDGLLLPGILSSGSCRTWLVILLASAISLALMLPLRLLLKKAGTGLLFRAAVFLLAFFGVLLNLWAFRDFILHCLLPGSKTLFLLVCIVLTALLGAARKDTLQRSLHLLVPLLTIFLLLAAALAATAFHPVHFQYLPPVNTGTLAASLPLPAAVLSVRVLLLLYCTDLPYAKPRRLLWGGVGILFTQVLTALLLLLSVGVLGGGLYEQLTYPLFYPLGLTVFGEYMERAEVLSAALLMILLVLKLCTLFLIMEKSFGHPASQETRSLIKSFR